MSIATYIEKIRNSKNTIRNKLVTMGKVDSSAKLEACAEAIDSIMDNGAVSKELKEGESFTIPEGYHNGSGTVRGVKGGGNYSLQEKTVTPTKSQQSVTPDESYYGLSAVSVGVIPAAYQDVTAVTADASDVLSPKVIVKSDGSVTAGTMPNIGTYTDQIDGLAETEVTIPKGYHDGKGKISLTGDIESQLAAI